MNKKTLLNNMTRSFNKVMETESTKKSWHAIQRECNCEITEAFKWDLEGEDCNAYDYLDELKSEGLVCEYCGRPYIFRIIKTK